MTPNPPPRGPPVKTPEQQEEEMLELMKWCFYVYSGLVGMSTLVLGAIVIAVTVGVGMAASEHHADADTKIGLGIVGVVFGLAALLLLVKTVLVFFAGRFVGERSHYTFIFVVAIICMINIPFGTGLGIFTLIWLTKDPIKRRFGVTGV